MAKKRVRVTQRESGFDADADTDIAGSESQNDYTDKIPAQEETITPEVTLDDLVSDEPVATFEVPHEKPKRKYTKRPKRASRSIEPDTSLTPFVLNLCNILGNAFAGEAGMLNESESALLTMSLDEAGKRYGAQVEKYSGYIYPVCGVVALGLWGKRILEVRNERKVETQINQQSNAPITPDTSYPTTDNSPPASNQFGDTLLTANSHRPF